MSDTCLWPTPISALVVLLATTAAFGQKVGDRIVVTAEGATLKTQNDTVGSVRRGRILTVKELNGDWFWVIPSDGNETVKGWINRRDVIPFEKALEFFSTALRRNPTAEFYCIRGMIRMERQDYDKAIADFKAAIRLDPKFANAYSARDLAQRKLADLDQAGADHGKAPRRDPEHAVSFYKRGLARRQKGEFDKAIEDFDQALRFDPTYANAYAARGVAWQNKGEIGKSIADFDEAIRLDPNQSAFHGNRGIAWCSLGRFEKAIADFNDATRLDSKNLHAHCALAWLLATCPDDNYRDGKRAVELATIACELSGWKNAFGIGALAAAYAESGDFANAVKWQEEFLRLCPEGDKKKWSFLLELYKSGKAFRERRQEFRFGGQGRFSNASVV